MMHKKFGAGQRPAPSKYLVCRSVRRYFRPLRGAAVAMLVRKATVDKACPRGDELADDHVLLQTEERVSCGTDRRARQHLDRMLERGSREERVCAQRSLGHTKQDFREPGRLFAFRKQLF